MLRYLSDRGISDHTAVAWELGIVADPEPGHEDFAGRLVVPYLTPGGVVGMKFRCLLPHDCKEVKCPKYLTMPGMGTRLFGTWALQIDTDRMCICEGELDTIVTNAAGLPAVGCAGSEAWRDWWGYAFEGYSDVIILRDGDQAGRKLADTIMRAIPQARAVGMPDGQDVSDFVLAHGAAALAGRVMIL